MPFAIKDVLQHKRNDRQIREIHEREYSKYLTNLRQQQPYHTSHMNQYYLPSNHIKEVERARIRTAVHKQNQYARIQRENSVLYDRLLKASKQSMIDDKNKVYQQNLDIFNLKRHQQRFNEYKRIENDNHLLLERLYNVRGHLVSKKECDNDWKKHVDVMKQTCDYPENIDKFISKKTKHQKREECLYSTMRNIQWNDRHTVIKPTNRLPIKSLTMLLNES